VAITTHQPYPLSIDSDLAKFITTRLGKKIGANATLTPGRQV
jgi:hypothetical protein